MPKKRRKKQPVLDRLTDISIEWIGSTASIIFHTAFFVGIFVLFLFGYSINTILLILTTIVSLEAIYLAIFIQRTVNKQAEEIEDIQEDLEEAEEDRDKTAEETARKTLRQLEKPLHELVAEIREDVKELLQDQRKANGSKITEGFARKQL